MSELCYDLFHMRTFGCRVAGGLAIVVLWLTDTTTAQTAEWIVTGDRTVSDTSMVLEGNLRVKSGGSLTLRGVQLEINCERDGECAIVAEPGSSLRVENCRIGPGKTGRRFLFYVEKARFLFTGNELRGAGFGLFTETRSLGLALIETDGAVIEGNTIYHERASGIALERARHTSIRDNKVFHLGEGGFGIILSSSSDNILADNTLVAQNEAILVQQHSFNNRIIANTIRDSLIGIFLRHGAGNNLVEWNTIVAQQKPTFWALAVDKTASPNMLLNNTVRGARTGLLISYASRLLAANNLFAEFAVGHAPGNLGAIHLFRSSEVHLLNNRIERARDGGITLLFSSDNKLGGNVVSESKHGIALYHESDNNRLEANLLVRNGVNVILEKAFENTIILNRLEASSTPDFDRGGNTWSRNFWSDYRSPDRGDGVGSEPRRIPPGGVDRAPLVRAPALEPAAVPGWSPVPVLPQTHMGRGSLHLPGEVVWANRVVEYVWHWLVIGPGSSLTLRNCTLLASSDWSEEPVIWVQAGGALTIVDSTVMGRERDVPLSITVEPGGRLEVRNSVFKNLGWTPGVEHGLRVRSEGAVIENNRFEGCFSCITLESGRGHRIVGNRIARAQFGILTPPWLEGSEITRNEISDTVDGFDPARALAKPEPLLPQIEAVVNAASLAPGPVAPGSLVTIFGKNLGRRALAATEAAFALGGCSVHICGAPARLFYSSPRQVNALVPLSAAGKNECELVVRCARLDELGEAISSPVRIGIVPVAISLFEFRPVRADGVPVSPAFHLPLITDGGNLLIGPGDVGAPDLRPASPGEVVVLWGTGGGLTLPPVAETENAPAGGSSMAGPLLVSIGGLEARVLYAGLAPGYAGLYQFNVEVPPGVPRGKVELQVGQPSVGRSYDLWIQ